MEFDDLIQKAAEKAAEAQKQMAEPFYVRTIAWLHYLGLLRHNTIAPQRHEVHISEALRAGQLEPRILELLPAIMILLPEAFTYTSKDLPKDLGTILSGIRKRKPTNEFRNVSPQAYLQWLNAPVMDIARRRLNYHHIPRKRVERTHLIGEIIRENRLQLALTQNQLAEKYNLSLRVIRDLEQGKMDASLKTVNEILRVFGRSLRA